MTSLWRNLYGQKSEYIFLKAEISYYRDGIKKYFIITNERKAEYFADLCRESENNKLIRSLQINFIRDWIVIK